jgi:hypothetical protein
MLIRLTAPIEPLEVRAALLDDPELTVCVDVFNGYYLEQLWYTLQFDPPLGARMLVEADTADALVPFLPLVVLHGLTVVSDASLAPGLSQIPKSTVGGDAQVTSQLRDLG